ncbi:MAG TPA: Na/Pi symporter [Bacilli bacterium]
MFRDILLPLLAGLSVFLFGLKVMELALHVWAAPFLRRVLQNLTRNPWRGLVTGTAITAALQSSSAVTVITIGLVNAGVITFPQTLGIILGTNIGTCLTTELIGLNISHLALPLLLVTAAIWLIAWGLPAEKFTPLGEKSVWIIRHLSLALAGFACILIGMKIMEAFVPAVQTRGLFAWFLEQSQKSLVWGILAGAALTAVIQSSAASIAITMGLASVQAISVELGVAIILGANIGTCVTALIASIGGSKYGQLVAWAHVLLNIGGAIVFYPLIGELRHITEWLAANPSGQLAHAQTIYNIVCSLLALPFCYMPWLSRIQNGNR